MEVYCEKDRTYQDKMSQQEIQLYLESFRDTIDEVNSSHEAFVYISNCRDEKLSEIRDDTPWVSLRLMSCDSGKRLFKLRGYDRSINVPRQMVSYDLDEIKARIEDHFLETDIRPRDGVCLKTDCTEPESYHL